MSGSPTVTTVSSTATQPVLRVIGQMVNGQAIASLPAGSMVGDRFQVIAPYLWKDTQPDALLNREMGILAQTAPYLRLYHHRLHIPEVYGTYQPQSTEAPVLLLDHIPLDRNGDWLPLLTTQWQKAPAVRQLQWLWQLGELWHALDAEGVASSLITPDNLYVDGWCVRLGELIPDPVQSPVTLQHLSDLWLGWVDAAQDTIREDVRAIAQSLQRPDAQWGAIAPTLNQLMLEQAALLPLRLEIAGGTSPGPQRSLNEDACYPITLTATGTQTDTTDTTDLIPRLAIVCDGIGGHEGGEVASHLTVRALKLQISALLTDLTTEDGILPPDVVMRQLEAAIRVVNNLVAFQNNEQNRESRQRMGTTLVMALQLPQRATTPNGSANAHELYIAQVGDSRAYWLTPQQCHCLTVDDDVKTREVLACRSFPREAERRIDSIALTQALGTRSGEYLRIKLQRFVVDEDGVLLLCSDGLSDTGLIDRYWHSMANNVLRGKLPLNQAVKTWLKLANQHNTQDHDAQDNVSVVLMRCLVSKGGLDLFDPTVQAAPIQQKPFTRTSAPSERPDGRSEAVPPKKAKISKPPSRKAKPKSNQKSSKITQKKSPSTTQTAERRQATREAFNVDQTAPSRSTELDGLDELAHTLLETYDVEQYTPEQDTDDDTPAWNLLAIAFGLSVIMFLLGAGGVVAWREFAPESFNQRLNQVVNAISNRLAPADGAADMPEDTPIPENAPATEPE